MNWIRRKAFAFLCRLRWMRLSTAQRAKALAMHKLLSNVFTNAPIDKIRAGESCSWDLPEPNKQAAMQACSEYVVAVKAMPPAGAEPKAR